MPPSKSPSEILAYQLLGLSPEATLAEVKQAFRDLAFQFHPDRNPNNPLAEENFKKVAQAYALLSGNREMFLALEKPMSEAQSVQRFVGDLFGDIFNIDAQSLNARNQDLTYVLKLRASKRKKASRHKIALMRQLFCQDCGGTGSAEGSRARLCTYCFGTGFIEFGENALQPKLKRQCPQCLGFGRNAPRPCAGCQGRGVRAVFEKMKVTLPAGLQAGQEVRFKGLGSQARRDQSPGDLLIQIQQSAESSFTFDGARNLCEIFSKFLKRLKHFLSN